MSGDDPQRGDRRSDRTDRTARSEEDDGTEGDGDASRTRPEPPADAGSGSSPTDVVDDVPVSKSVLGGFGTVLVLYVVLGLFLAIGGLLFLNLYGGTLVNNPLVQGQRIGDLLAGVPVLAFYGLVGPALALPVGLWMGDGAESPLATVPAAAIANGIGHFVMALSGAVLLAFEFDGLQVVDLVIPYLFAAVFAAIIAALAAAASAFLS